MHYEIRSIPNVFLYVHELVKIRHRLSSNDIRRTIHALQDVSVPVEQSTIVSKMNVFDWKSVPVNTTVNPMKQAIIFPWIVIIGKFSAYCW